MSSLKCYICNSLNLLVNNVPICKSCLQSKLNETVCLSCKYIGHVNKDHFCLTCISSMLALSINYKIVNIFSCIFTACTFKTSDFWNIQSHLGHVHRLVPEQLFKSAETTHSIQGKLFFFCVYFLYYVLSYMVTIYLGSQ